MSELNNMRVGIIAPSSVTGQVELDFGLEQLRGDGFDVVRHAQCARQHFTFAGTDEDRAAAIWEMATDSSIEMLWCARGGYGAARLLPILERLTKEHGAPPKKLLVGYSDITVLHQFVHRRWGWSTLHAVMPAADLGAIRPEEWRATVELVKRKRPTIAYEQPCLKFMRPAPAKPRAAELVGGNLSLWASLMGTPWQPDTRGKILFLEDLGEPYYRIDRMFTQVVQSSGLDGAAAIVLGDFTDCKDESNQVLKPPASDEERETMRKDRKSAEKIPLRPVYQEREAFDAIFGEVGRRMGIPVAYGLPVGHGPNFAPLPLGARYELRPDGSMKLLEWDWIS
jgi:muramoyltetrapeptide carboxypeptidase